MKGNVVNILSGTGFVCVCVCVCVCVYACVRALSVININADISTTELETNCESGRDWDWTIQAKK